MPEQHVDVLIVGAGLSGSLLAWHLLEQGIKTHIVYDPHIQSASRVAAGLINPVTGQRLVLQNNAADLLTTAHQCYHQLSQQFGVPFLFEKEILRLLTRPKEQQAWHKRKADSAYTAYLSEHPKNKHIIIQHQTGYLDTHALLNTLISHFHRLHCLSETPFLHTDLHATDDQIIWQNIAASRIIFCEGWRGQNNPWFQHLPFQPAKGEILDLQSSSTPPNEIIHHGQWLLPMHDGRLRLGATYDNKPPLSEAITQTAKTTLLSTLSSMPIQLNDLTVIGQKAGIRPNTLDKSPFLGFHEKNSRIGIFNGFGSKGSLLIPWYAKVFTQHILNQHPLPKHVDIQRFAHATD